MNISKSLYKNNYCATFKETSNATNNSKGEQVIVYILYHRFVNIKSNLIKFIYIDIY